SQSGMGSSSNEERSLAQAPQQQTLDPLAASQVPPGKLGCCPDAVATVEHAEQGRLAERPRADVEYQGDERVDFVRRELDQDVLADGGLGDLDVTAEQGAGLRLGDLLARAHVLAGVAVADRPDAGE